MRERCPEVLKKEFDRLRKLHEVRVPNWYPNLTVRFRDRAGGFKNNNTPVATIHGIIDILVLLPGKSAAELRSQITNVELDRLRKLYEGGVPNWYPTLTVRFRDNTGRFDV